MVFIRLLTILSIINQLELMGNSDSRHPDIIMQHQKLEEWMKVEDQGFCELWLHNKTGRQLQAYPIAHSVAADRQQQEKYAFRKAHGSHLVAIEGILGESDGFLCSQPRTSYVLVENIVSRLGQHHRSFSFQQALYILSSAATGYNTLNSFFGPLEPNQDMICINEQGTIKVWLNENLSKNEPSTNARSLEDSRGNAQSPAEDYTIAKRRIKQCVSKLFKIVEEATLQGFPLQFREESRNVSTYFEAVNFVEHFSQQNNIKMAENLPINSIKVLKKAPIIETVPSQTTIVQNIQFASQPSIREQVGNLDSSRVQNIVFKSNYGRESGFASPGLKGSHAVIERIPPILERSRTEQTFIPASLYQSPQQPRISFQVRPSVTYMASPVRTTHRYHTAILPSPSQPQILHFPPQRVMYSPVINAATPQQVVQAVSEEILPKPIDPQIEPKQSVVQIEHHLEVVESQLKDPENITPVETQNIEVDKAKHERENSNVQFTQQAFSEEKSDGVQQQVNPIEEQPNINQTNFTFQSQQMKQELLQRAREEAALEQDIRRNQGEQKEPQPEPEFNEAMRLRNTDGYVQSEEDDARHEYEYYEEYYENPQYQQEIPHQQQAAEEYQQQLHPSHSHGYTDSQYSQIDQYVPPPEYREYRDYRERSPIPEQEESFPPSPTKDHKNSTEIEEWEAQLNKFTLSTKKADKSQLPPQKYTREHEQQRKNPQSNRQTYAEASKEQYVNEMANLNHDDIEKYIRMKYQLYLGQDGPNPTQNPAVGSFPTGFKRVESMDYQNSYENKLSSYKEKDPYPSYNYESYENKPIIGKENYEPYKNTYQYEVNDQYIPTNRVSIDNNFIGNSTGRSSVQTGYPNIYNNTSYENKYDLYKEEYQPRKDSIKNRQRVPQTSKIDEKYSKYVLNSQKIKPPVSRGTNSRDISLVIPVDQSKILYMSPHPTYERQVTKKSTYEASESNPKKGITYEKLRNLLWEQ